jgi:hypothetical protein
VLYYFLTPIVIILIIISWAAIWLFSRVDDDDGELEELTGVVNVRRNNQNNTPIDPKHTERAYEEFND